MNENRATSAAKAILSRRRGKKIKVFTPESDFMEEVEVDEGSPEHVRIMRSAAQMEPDGPEAKELRRRKIK